MDNFIDFWNDLFQRPISELNFVHVIILIAIAFVGFKLLKFILKYLLKGLKAVGTAILGIFSPKAKCSKTLCRHCQRTLDKCVCNSNRGKSYFVRLYRYNREGKNIRKKLKEKQ